MIFKNYKNYCFVFIASAFLTTIFVGIFNYVVDPYGFYRFFDANGFNQQKEGVRSKIRYVKALELPLREPKTVIIGSSRVHDSLNPNHNLLNEPQYQPVYNLGIDMARIHESFLYLKHAMANSEIRRVILGIDFFMFNASQKENGNFDSSLVGREIMFSDYISTSIFSADAFFDSIQTLKISYRTPDRKEFLSNGFRPGKMVFYGLKNYSALHYYTNYTFMSSLPNETKYYANITSDERVFNDFEEILKLCKKNHVELKVYISPAHANLDGEGIKTAGKWEEMELWKLKVVRLTDIYEIPLWDFSGYNSITTEQVKTPMKFYWDSSHFTEVVSDMILKRIFYDGVNVPDDFGVKLTKENIESHISQIRKDQANYFDTNQAELLDLRNSYRSFLNDAPIDVQKIEGMF